MMCARILKPAGNEKGATAVEFAIVLPLLLLVVFGVIEWGLYMYNSQVITNAAREGARHGVLMRMAPRDITAENNAICARVVAFAGSRLVTFGTGELTCVPEDNITRGDPDDPPSNPLAFGTDLRVQISFDYDFLFLSLPPLSLGPLPITSEATMKME
jgi:Flp pilus assembly protein TadG